jgi:hypothetical protein
VRWDRLFEDLEDQLASEWEAERAALDSEAERVRIARMTLRSRLSALTESPPRSADRIGVEVLCGDVLTGSLHAVGADFAAIRADDAVHGLVITPIAAIASVTVAPHALVRSARPRPHDRAHLSERLTFGFVLRDVARRRIPVRVVSAQGRGQAGTIDRVAADHLDLAVHDAGTPRRQREITAVRIVPFAGIACVHLDADAAPALL